jgi:hypothetical protein
MYKKNLLQSTSSTERISEMLWRQIEAYGGVNVDQLKFDCNNLPLFRSIFTALCSVTPTNLAGVLPLFTFTPWLERYRE